MTDLSEGLAEPAVKSHKCEFSGCSKAFTRATALYNHVRAKHTLEKPFTCSSPICLERFSSSDSRQKHIARVHEGRRDFVCGSDKDPRCACACGKAYATRYELNRHHNTLKNKHQHILRNASPPTLTLEHYSPAVEAHFKLRQDVALDWEPANYDSAYIAADSDHCESNVANPKLRVPWETPVSQSQVDCGVEWADDIPQDLNLPGGEPATFDPWQDSDLGLDALFGNNEAVFGVEASAWMIPAPLSSTGHQESHIDLGWDILFGGTEAVLDPGASALMTRRPTPPPSPGNKESPIAPENAENASIIPGKGAHETTSIALDSSQEGPETSEDWASFVDLKQLGQTFDSKDVLVDRLCSSSIPHESEANVYTNGEVDDIINPGQKEVDKMMSRSENGNRQPERTKIGATHGTQDIGASCQQHHKKVLSHWLTAAQRQYDDREVRLINVPSAKTHLSGRAGALNLLYRERTINADQTISKSGRRCKWAPRDSIAYPDLLFKGDEYARALRWVEQIWPAGCSAKVHQAAHAAMLDVRILLENRRELQELIQFSEQVLDDISRELLSGEGVLCLSWLGLLLCYCSKFGLEWVTLCRLEHSSTEPPRLSEASAKRQSANSSAPWNTSSSLGGYVVYLKNYNRVRDLEKEHRCVTIGANAYELMEEPSYDQLLALLANMELMRKEFVAVESNIAAAIDDHIVVNDISRTLSHLLTHQHPDLQIQALAKEGTGDKCQYARHIWEDIYRLQEAFSGTEGWGKRDERDERDEHAEHAESSWQEHWTKDEKTLRG